MTGWSFMKKYDNFARALSNLHEGARLEPPYTVVEQTGITALFEICFEQSWKLMKAVLEYNGRTESRTGSPRGIIKLSYQCGMINDEENWLALLETRNILAHTYSEEDALDAIDRIKNSYLSLFDELKRVIDEEWETEAGDKAAADSP